jgi:hypothetical protein
MIRGFFQFSNRLPCYFFLCDTQNFDLPVAEFLHCFPSLVFAAHLAFFVAVAILPPYEKSFLNYNTK